MSPGSVLPLRILGTGSALPVSRVSSEALDRRHGYSPGTCLQRSGVQWRHMAGPDDSQSDLGARALLGALASASLEPSEISLVLGACGVSEQALPGTACAIAAAAGIPGGVPAFDIGASCLSFLVAMQTAAALLATGSYHRIAIVAADLASRGLDWNNPDAAAIFGDGAAAAIVERGEPGQGISAWRMATYPEGRALCEIRAGGTRLNPGMGASRLDYLFRMDGKGVFRLAARVMPPLFDEVLAQAGCSRTQLDVVVPHQASHLAMQHIASMLQLPSSKIVNIYTTHGNQVGASLPFALHTAITENRIPTSGRVLLLGTGAGLSAAAMVLQT